MFLFGLRSTNILQNKDEKSSADQKRTRIKVALTTAAFDWILNVIYLMSLVA